MADISPEKEILQAFIKNANQKVQELNGIANIIMKEGLKNELFDAIYRVSSEIKTFASSCNQNQIVYFLVSSLDTQFNMIRVENKEISQKIKNEIKENIATLKEMINKIPVDPPTVATDQQNLSYEEDPRDSQLALMSAIGQLSVWSFHEIMNSFARVHGYTEMLEDVIQQLPPGMPQLQKDLKLIEEKIVKNTAYMTGVINRIRALRGKTKVVSKEHNIRDLTQIIQEFTQQPKKTIDWSTLNIPSVHVLVDQIVFEQVWVNLWKLLGEWQTGSQGKSMCFGLIEKNKFQNNSKLKNLLNLYIWIEPANEERISPETLSYQDQTEHTDIANVFYHTSKIAQKMNLKLSYAKTDKNIAVFRINTACDDILHAVSKSTGAEIPQPLHLTKETVKDKTLKFVLILDDEKDLRSLLSMKLSKFGYGVYAAANIAEAIEILKTKDIKLVISDIFLGEESGLEFLMKANEVVKNIPFIFISGADQDNIPGPILEIMSKYSKTFLNKPITNQVLKQTLDKVLPIN